MRGQFAVLFNELAAADGAALFHCTAGKDRTGWTAAMLLMLEPSLGVRVSHVDLNGFTEKGSELALQADDLKETRRSAVANLKASFAPIPVDSWRLVPE